MLKKIVEQFTQDPRLALILDSGVLQDEPSFTRDHAGHPAQLQALAKANPDSVARLMHAVDRLELKGATPRATHGLQPGFVPRPTITM